MCGPSGGTTLAEPVLVPRIGTATVSSTVANANEERPSLQSKGVDMLPLSGAVDPACLASGQELSGLPQGVMRTITEARDPSTRRLYDQKLSFSQAGAQLRR